MPNRTEAFKLIPVVLAMALCLVTETAAAKDKADYPYKPIRLLVQVVPGGGTDTTARAIARKLTEAWGQQVVVDNRPGAAGAIALEMTAKAAPDGYTLCMVAASQIINAAVNPAVPYDFSKDFAPISQLTSLFYVVYHTPSLPVNSIKELLAYAKANPGKLNYGSAGSGSLQHVAIEMFSHTTGIRLVHVPYKGGGAALSASLVGEVQFGFASLIGIRPHLANGRLRALAITARERSAAVPELPTMAEAGVPGFEVDQWYGMVTAAQVPPAVVRRVNAGVVQSLKSRDVVLRLAADGSTPVGSSPEEFATHIRTEMAKWSRVVREMQLVLN